MELFIIILMLALLQYILFSFQTGMARVKYGVKAPAVTGDPLFERFYRVQQNTLEQLVVFIPAMVAFAFIAERIAWPGFKIATGLGGVWLLGRTLYARAYLKDPESRGLGFMLTFLPSVGLLAGTLIACVLAII